MRFLLALIFIFLTMPLAASAHLDPTTQLIIIFSWLVVLNFLIPISPLYLLLYIYILRHKSHTLLLLIDTIFSITYAFLSNWGYSRSELLILTRGYAIPALLFFSVIWGTILFIKKRGGRDVLTLNKVFMHGIITGVMTILLSFSFAYGAVWILYFTNCDKNLILSYPDKESEEYSCIYNTAVNKNDPYFCNKFSDYDKEMNDRAIMSCKVKVNVKMVESGDMSGCDYFKSNEFEVNYLYDLLFYIEKEVLNKCGVQSKDVSR